MSRIVWSKRESERADAPDEGTLFFGGLRGPPFGFTLQDAFPAPSFQEVFLGNYAAIRTLLNGHAEPGLSLVVANREGLQASAWFEARDRDINPLIIGRHSAADIFLPSDPELSLRHLAVLLHGRRSGGQVRFRVLDLRTPTAFADEKGARLEAVEAQGPLMLHCASFAILFFPTNAADAPWPKEPEEAWKRIPERRYLESASADPARWYVPGGRARGVYLEPVEAGARERTSFTPFPVPSSPRGSWRILIARGERSWSALRQDGPLCGWVRAPRGRGCFWAGTSGATRRASPFSPARACHGFTSCSSNSRGFFTLWIRRAAMARGWARAGYGWPGPNLGCS